MQPPIFAGRGLREVRPGAVAGGVANSHGQVIAAAGGTGAGDTSLGTITLPAGGPWLIHGVYCLHARATNTAGEASGGTFSFVSLDGDIQPNPAPSRFPMSIYSSFLGATGDVQAEKLKIFEVAWEAPGKGRLEFIVNEPTANTAAPQYVMGVLYGKSKLRLE